MTIKIIFFIFQKTIYQLVFLVENNILNGLAPSMLINFNNGTPNQQERKLIENKIAQKFSGTSNAGKFILAFNDNKESQAEITPVNEDLYFTWDNPPVPAPPAPTPPVEE